MHCQLQDGRAHPVHAAHHLLFMLTTAAMTKPDPRSADAFGPVHALQEALKLGKDIHIFLSSGTSLILEGPSGYSCAMQRALDLTACKSFGVGKLNLFKRLVLVQPATNNTTMATKDSSVKEIMAQLNMESSNTARLMSINSSSSNFMLRTFLSITETFKVEELKDDMEEGLFSRLRHAFSFQCVTRLQNFVGSNQVGEMKRTFLSRRQTVASEGRS